MNAPSKLTAWERWELASFDAPAEVIAEAAEETVAAEAESAPVDVVDVDTPPNVQWPTAEEIEEIHRQAREQGYERGVAEGKEEGFAAGQLAGNESGFAAGQVLAHAEAERLGAAANQLEQALATLESQVAEELLALALELARGVIRQEISARPEALLTVVREAMAQLPHQHTAIYLNPEDASLVRSYLGDQLAHAGHRIHEDFKLKHGDCLLEAGGTQLDATVAMRWRRVLDELGIKSAWEPEQSELDLGSDPRNDPEKIRPQ